ncbi:(2Fe-2S)-binding protein [Desulforhopalus singaporensis]|uniref:2Fe-2S iron-sulfur cluster binding domain-containing protein n=1 Tax=Desulforhopalus singaporensis TaxID=91360 RepID=A0A1H0PJI3_9BACT|nr:(2Fe-2S)-binding protein [Desulforhopalus singaporensis]SDP05282.1 2Fe-2S iron-sulfur cluster binding domain-containing protein [Desulforhopalus singaporensis]
MKNGLQPTVTLTVDDKEVTVPTGISVAAAVLGHLHLGCTCVHPVDKTPRAPYCLMGVCFECMMEVNGEENVQTCLVSVEDGMVVKRQLKVPEAK